MTTKRLKHELLDIVFDIREKISDLEYKTLSETIAKIDSENETEEENAQENIQEYTEEEIDEILEEYENTWAITKNVPQVFSEKMIDFLWAHTTYRYNHTFDDLICPEHVMEYIIAFIDEHDLCDRQDGDLVGDVKFDRRFSEILMDLFNVCIEAGEILTIENIIIYIMDHY